MLHRSKVFQPKSLAVTMFILLILRCVVPTYAIATSIVINLDTTNATFNINAVTGEFSNGNGQSIVSIFEDGIENTTDPLIGALTRIQGIFLGSSALPFDTSGTLINVTTEIFANNSVIYSDLSLEAYYNVGIAEWFGKKTGVNLNNTIGSAVLDRFAMLNGFTVVIDQFGVVSRDSEPFPEPSILWLFAIGCLSAVITSWRAKRGQRHL